MDQQRDDGSYPSNSPGPIHAQAIAVNALSEAYNLSGGLELLGEPARRGVDRLVAMLDATWRGRPSARQPKSDSSASFWITAALLGARDAGLIDAHSVIDSLRDRVLIELRDVEWRSDPAEGVFPGSSPTAVVADALLSGIFLGQDPFENPLRVASEWICGHPPSSSESGFRSDPHYWYPATYALLQMGGKEWSEWNRVMVETIVEQQVGEGEAKGSWPPMGPRARSGGRIESTALATLCLEVYYRYGRFVRRPRK